MNNKIAETLEKIIMSTELFDQFFSLNSIEEAYDYCQSVQSGYTKEEFEYALAEILELAFGKGAYMNSLSEIEVSKVVGGSGFKKQNKLLAGVLSALLFSPYTGKAMSIGGVASASASTAVSKNALVDFVHRNKGKIKAFVVTALAVTACVLFNKHVGKKVKDKRDNVLKKLNQENAAGDEQTLGEFDKKLEEIGGLVSKLSVDNKDNKEKVEVYHKQAGIIRQRLNDLKPQVQKNKKLMSRYGIEVVEVKGEKPKLNLKKFNWFDDVKCFYEYSTTKDNPNDDKEPEGLMKGLFGKMGSVVVSAGAIWKAADWAFSGLSRFSKKLSDVSSMGYSINNISYTVGAWFDKVLQQTQPLPMINFDNIHDAMNAVFGLIKGQGKAKKEIWASVQNMLREKDYYRRIGKQRVGCSIFYFVGASGVGKSLMASSLANSGILTDGRACAPYFVNGSAVNHKSRIAPIDQLFGAHPNSGGYGSQGASATNPSKDSLAAYIAKYPDGVVVVDEYDKLLLNCSDPRAIDEAFRCAMDLGFMTVSGRRIDVSRVTFIFTSNESAAGVKFGNQGSIDGNLIDDGTGSRTFISHDKSFINRIPIIEFEKLSEEELAEIARAENKLLIEDYWAIDDVGNILISFPDETYRNIAKAAYVANEGARYIRKLRGKLFSTISDVVSAAEFHDGRGCLRGKKLFVYFDSEIQEFTLKNEAGQVMSADYEEDDAFSDEHLADKKTADGSAPDSENIVDSESEKVDSENKTEDIKKPNAPLDSVISSTPHDDKTAASLESHTDSGSKEIIANTNDYDKARLERRTEITPTS